MGGKKEKKKEEIVQPVEYIDNEAENEEDEAMQAALELVKNGNIAMFQEGFNKNAEAVLHALLSIQTNDNPLKKGGEGVAFRCDSLILKNRQKFSSQENTLLDILTGYISSRPEDEFYTIPVSEIIQMLPYNDEKYAYKLLSSAAKKLNRRPFVFEVELENGNTIEAEFHWNDLLVYNGKAVVGDKTEAFISFTPSKFFRIITLSSSIMHGAHYGIAVSAQIQSAYVKTLFYYLESVKYYKDSPTSPAGVITISLEKLQEIVQYPQSYDTYAVKQNILDKGVSIINNLENVDFTFTYELQKTKGETGKKKFSHVTFTVTPASRGNKKERLTLPECKNEKSEDAAVTQLLAGIGLSEKESADVLKKYNSNHRDLAFLAKAIEVVSTKRNVKTKTGLLCHIMDNGIEAEKKDSEKKSKKKNTQFEQQREYDEKELELLSIVSQGYGIIDSDRNRSIVEGHQISYKVIDGKIYQDQDELEEEKNAG